MRRTIAAGVMLALAFVGLVAQPAAAGDTGLIISKVGSASPAVRLDPGLYEITFSYSASSYDLMQSAWLISKEDGEIVPEMVVAFGSGEKGSSRRIFLSDGRKLWLDVHVDDDVAWRATVKPVIAPTAVKTSLSVSAKGVNASKPVLLEKGVYSYKASYSGNEDDVDVNFVAISAFDLASQREHVLVEQQQSVGGKETGTFIVARRGLVWIDTAIASFAPWKVTLKRLPGVTSSANPKISGTAKVGKTLTAKPGTWKPSGVTLSYQWYRDGKKIEGATKKTYKLTKSDKGKKIVVKVKGKKSGYSWTTKASKATSKVT
ncbi:hypothetical protein [Tessaracoccus caeni]|uniref:hypothetical protein n=1 Tax=Tessaracoccus caeni TaxID=3031239 RepID=UPI0023DACE60|nr:hypothetical protein [Tessaracoccus caeni]MDF1488875.1 hypothetical protein [Tessaracoccus caeni]